MTALCSDNIGRRIPAPLLQAHRLCCSLVGMDLERAARPRFEPWIPSGDGPRLEGVRLLILGESHYEEPAAGVFNHTVEDVAFTQKVVRRWGARPEGRQRFFANLFEVMTGESWSLDADHDRLWRHVFFYNYVQFLVCGEKGRTPSAQEFERSGAAFRSVLEQVRPEGVLVMGARLWRNMTKQDEWVGGVSGDLEPVCAYHLKDGSKVLAAHMWHPSAPGFRVADWRPRVQSYLADVAAFHAKSANAHQSSGAI